jgi:hypothetical protein
VKLIRDYMKLRACALSIASATYRKHLISPQTSSNFHRQQRFESLTGNSNKENVYFKHVVPCESHLFPGTKYKTRSSAQMVCTSPDGRRKVGFAMRQKSFECEDPENLSM